MSEEIDAAIEAACSSGMAESQCRPRSFERTKAMIRTFLRNVPEELSVRELLEEVDGD